jgi:hypothetical protein
MGSLDRSFGTFIVVLMIVLMAIGCTENGGDDEPDDVIITPAGILFVSRSEGNYLIDLPTFDPILSMNDSRYELLNGSDIVTVNGTQIAGIVSDISYDPDWGAVFRDPEDGSVERYVVWSDSDADWNLSAADTIFLMGLYNDWWNGSDAEPGIADTGMVLRLIYIPNGEVIASVELN